MKVVKNVDKYLDAAFEEADILKRLHQNQTSATPKLMSVRAKYCLRMHSYFKIRHKKNKHVCLLFPKLGRSLYSFLKSNRKIGFELETVKRFGYQLCLALAFCHENQLVHTDLKPENILLRDSSFTVRDGTRVPIISDICLIDFGGATFDDQHHSSIIATRQYRPPEVILGLLWDYSADMWAVACILSELLTGKLFFPTHENLEHLAMMEYASSKPLPRCLMAPSSERVEEAGCTERQRAILAKWDKRHDEMLKECCGRTGEGKLNWPAGAANDRSIERVTRIAKIEEVSKDKDMVDLLRKLLDFDPKTRITAEQCLKHPFFASIAADYEG